ncbi:flavodoxin [Methanocella sp. MCL-LM]|uniref:flavodoxin n=1 Tax=Methanocella sp. MCL-LM TaxID=3412035 RepID=UPI003C744042
MAGPLKAEVKKAGEVDASKLAEYDLIGFGSGIYMGKHHKNLLKLADGLPKMDKNAFIFSTSGGANENFKDHKALRAKLEEKGFRIVDEFNCLGWDTFGPLVLIGGFNKGRPDESDLEKARQFAARVAGQ